VYFLWEVYYHLLCVFGGVLPQSDESALHKFVVDFNGSHGGVLVAGMAAGVHFFNSALYFSFLTFLFNSVF